MFGRYGYGRYTQKKAKKKKVKKISTTARRMEMLAQLGIARATLAAPSSSYLGSTSTQPALSVGDRVKLHGLMGSPQEKLEEREGRIMQAVESNLAAALADALESKQRLAEAVNAGQAIEANLTAALADVAESKQELAEAVKARQQAEADQLKAGEAASSRDCDLCREPESPGSVAMCSTDGHAVCRTCFEGYARAEFDQDPAVIRARGAQLLCPFGVNDCGGHFTEQTIAQMLPADLYRQHDEQRRNEIRSEEWIDLNKHMMSAIRRMAENLQQSAPGMTKELLAKQLRASIPGALMCGRCHYGPIEHYGCPDMTAHRREGVTGNACPKCGWFASDRKNWPLWDGNVPDSAIDPVKFAVDPCHFQQALKCDSFCLVESEKVAKQMDYEERQRLEQIETDRRLALQLSAQ